jgi:hypothetical protein
MPRKIEQCISSRAYMADMLITIQSINRVTMIDLGDDFAISGG